MALVSIDVEDYLDEVSTKDLVAELRRRRQEVPVEMPALGDVIALLELGRWREALDHLKLLAREGAPLTDKERDALAAKYAAAPKRGFTIGDFISRLECRT